MNKKRANETSSDGDLLELLRKGDEDAFLILYRRHQASIFRFALHMSGSREVAEEITQDVFLAMIKDPKRYTEALGSLQPYLIGMARNQVRQQLRRNRPFVWEEIEQAGISPEEEMSRDEQVRILRTAILSLPPNYREVVVLCDLEGEDYGQAAAVLHCAVGTVRSRLHRARSILQAKLRRRERCPA